VTFATVCGVDAETYAADLGTVEVVSDVRLLGEYDDEFRVSVRTSGQTLAGTLATHGGRTTDISVDDDGLRLTAELPRPTHVQEVKRAAQSVHDDVELVGYRTRARETRERTNLRQRVATDLSDKQAMALELAHYGGYYAWPRRESSLENLASTMDVSPQTVHEHLRKAEAKLVGAYYDRQSMDDD
jgi:predicted DNA binding protein